jgi:hypothetical protein
MLVNGYFDNAVTTDISTVTGWTSYNPDIVLSYATMDAKGCSTSGSLLITNQAADGLNSGALQCVAVTPGASYDVGGSIYVPSGGAEGQSSITVNWYTGANCAGTPSTGTQLSADQFDTWQNVHVEGLIVPSETLSAAVYLQIVKTGADAKSYQSYYDSLYFSPSPATLAHLSGSLACQTRLVARLCCVTEDSSALRDVNEPFRAEIRAIPRFRHTRQIHWLFALSATLPAVRSALVLSAH